MALINPVKVVDKTTASPNDQLLYTMILSNTGPANATNVIVVDTLPTGVSFVGGSLNVNGTTVAGSVVPPGYTIGTITLGTTLTLTFNAFVVTIPTVPLALKNSYTALYSYTITTPVTTSSQSNTVTTTIPTASLKNLYKTVNKSTADVLDFLIYTITIPNNGSIAASNVIFRDTIPVGTTFIANSFILNNVTIAGANPGNGVNIGTIAAGGVSTITFAVQVTTVPTINPIQNNASTFYYSYGTTQVLDLSNTVQTQVNNGDLNIIKSVDFSYAKPTETLTYTILIKNTGSTSANNVYFRDTIPAGSAFIPNTVKLNGTTLAGATPDSLTNIGTISAGSYSIVTFKVTVDSPPTADPVLNSAVTSYSYLINPTIPTSEARQKNSNISFTDINTLPLQTTIPNIAEVNYKYVVDPSIPIITTGTSTSPKVDNFFNSAVVNQVKYVDKLYANVAETITYTVIFKNSGTVSANNVIFKDTIPNDTTFVANSVIINGVTVAGSPAPITGINIGTIPAFGVTTVTFKVTVNTIPSPNPIPNAGSVSYAFTVIPTIPNGAGGTTISNTVYTQVNNANINLNKIASLDFADVGNTITYTIVVSNVGNVSATSITFTDTIPPDTTFVANSVTVDGVTVAGSPAPPSGVSLGTIAAGGVSTVTFQITVNTIPCPNPIRNNATASYKFTVDPSVPNGVTGGDNSNNALTQVNNANLTLTKLTNLNFADIGSTITYTVIVKNVGNISANNVKIVDTLPNGTSFIANSVKLNGATIAGSIVPPNGVNIGTVAAGTVATVTFNVLVTTIPTPTTIVNTAFSNYRYTVDPSVPNGGVGVDYSNDVITQINTATLSMNKISIPRAGTVGTTITYIIAVNNLGNVSANNINFTDTIPNDTTFLANSVTIDGLTVPGSPAPPTGINIGTILAGAVRTITFQVVVDTIPTPNPLQNSAVTSYTYTVDPSVPNGVGKKNISNTVYTPIRRPYLIMTKSAIPMYGIEGTTITYTIAIDNIGNVDANDVVFTDTIPNDTTFVSNSVTVNGTSVAGSVAPPTGISLTTIALAGITTVTFSVVINTLPSPNPIPNSAVTEYKFTVDASLPNAETGSNISNIVNVKYNKAGLVSTKLSDVNYADVGTTITYTIVLENTGIVSANNVRLVDTIPNDTTFIVGSVEIDDIPVAGSVAPPNGATIPIILAGDVSTITFKVRVNTIPTPNPIPNSATANFKYTIDPSFPDGVSGSTNTNIKYVQVNNANLNLFKVGTPTYADVGTTITYTVVINNVGNVAATSINFTDTIPNDTTFVANSVTVNGTTVAGNPAPPSGVNIGTIAVGGLSTVTFQVRVNTIPTPNPIKNVAKTSYTYTVDPSIPNGGSGTDTSNTSSNQVNNANLTLTKTGFPSFADIGTTLTYTIVVRNVGNVTATSVTFTDTIPSDITYITNSLAINGSIVAGAPTPPTGILLGTILAGAASTVTFKVLITTTPSPNPIKNSATSTFKYTVDPSVPNGGSGGDNSNVLLTPFNKASLDMNKAVDYRYIDRGNTITYTIVMKNGGNLSANNVIFTDTIPPDTTFIANSLTINGSLSAGSPAPPTGVNLGTISAGTAVTINFEVYANTIPSPNPILNTGVANYKYTLDPSFPNGASGADSTNTVQTQVNNANLTMSKVGTPSFADVGTTVTYTVVIKNIGNVSANTITFIDTIPNDTTFVANSLKVDGVTIVGASPAPPTGANIGIIAGGGVSTITFNVVVNTIPSPNPLSNSATTTFKYTIDPSIPNGGSGGDNSNTTQNQVNNANLTLTKFTSLNFADVGSTITYTVSVKNVGNTSANNVKFIDTLPNGTTFIANSVKLNGATIAGSPVPPNGVNIGTIAAGGVSTVSFSVLVTTLPNPTTIVNTAVGNYRYTIDPSVPNGGVGADYSNDVITQINTATLAMNKISIPRAGTVGTTITYIVVVNNLGDASANNITFTDTIPNDTTFLANSVTIDGLTVPGSPAPPTGINIGTIAGGAVRTVTFQVVVDTIPTPNPLQNSAVTSFTYTVDPSIPNGAGKKNISNTVYTPIRRPYVLMSKAAVPMYGIEGTTITYTISMENYGNVDANDVVFTDTIPNDTTFVANSVTVNGVTVAGSPAPPTGISLTTLTLNTHTTLTFAVVINTVPSPNPIPNYGVINYKFTVDPSFPNGETGENISNIVNVQYNKAQLQVTKFSDVNYADVGSTITYIVVLENTGNVSANNVKFVDTIPNDTTFVVGSVEIDDNPVAGSVAPPNGVTIPIILAGDVSTVTFKVRVNTIPSPNPIPNSATSSFKYTIDPSLPNGGSGGASTNIKYVQVNNANLNLFKVGTPTYADVGTTITYTVVITNVGNVAATGINFIDTIPNDTTFVANSVKVNGTTVAGSPVPPSGVNIGTVAAGTVSTVTFQVTVNTIPTPNPILNAAKTKYNYTVDPSLPNGGSGEDNSNTSQNQVNNANLTMVKTGTPSFADIGTTITYTIVVRNVGNVAATSITFTDTIPSDITYIANSLAINSSIVAGAPTPPTGVVLGTILAGGVSTVTFKVLITTTPSPNPILNSATTRYKYTVDPSVPNGATGGDNSNIFVTPFNKANLEMTKFVSLGFADIGNTITYTVVMKNGGNLSANNIIFTDTIPPDTTFVSNSVTLNGTTVAGSPAPPTGIIVGTLAAGTAATVTFAVVVNTIPSPNPILNTGITSYKYTVDPSFPNGVTGGDISNTVQTQVNNANLTMSKAGNPSFADVGTTITYTIVLNNIGNVSANTITFIDTIPNNTTFVANSVTVNGTTIAGSPAPPSGVNIGAVAGGTVATVTFAVVVNTIPSPNPILNSATTTYKYTVDPSIPDGGSGGDNSNTSSNKVNNANLKMIKLGSSDFANIGTTITYTIVVSNVGNTAATSINFTDTIPNGTTFIPGSLAINTSIVAGSPAPPTGVTLGTIVAGGVSTVTFDVVINTIPSPNPTPNTAITNYKYTVDPSVPNGTDGTDSSNTILTRVNNAELTLSKSVNEGYAKCGDVLKYTVRLANVGNVEAINTVFKDTIPNGTQFINNSFTVNGVTLPGVDPNIGVIIGTIAAGAIATVTFSVTIVCQ